MDIHSERLKLKALNADQLEKYILGDGSLEEELGLKFCIFKISPELKEALEKDILPGVRDKAQNYIYSTIWVTILKEENLIIGDLCFAGEPGPEGSIEVGYGTREGHMNKGYMTEAVAAIIKWAGTIKEVKKITASSEISNKASSRVLQKNNFTICSEEDGLIKWEIRVLS